MSRAEEKAKESCYLRCPNGRNSSCNSCEFAEEPYRCLRLREFIAGYEQAEKDFMEKFKMWVAHNGYTAQESELVYNDFKQFITKQ